ncbi:protein FAM83H-like [Megalops cyprinoides]|uniref:protein FAM83H-like n=1 Tax=Megalops cyprinoides TaxID=118141 RepID=UPI001863DDF2|nr:protein FAM83H-like [Megalops cyprinoides]
MAHRSQSSSLGDNPLDPNYLPPHYREEYRLAIDALVEDGLEGYYEFLQGAGVVDFLSQTEIEHIKGTVQVPHSSLLPELPYQEVEPDGSSDTYWPVHSDLDAPGLDLGWPSHHSFIGPTEVTTLVNPSDPDMPSIKEQARRLIKNAQQVIAIVMDMFTDVDIFSDLLNATTRRVPVYILLDEQNTHHFAAMVTSCKVNLDMVPLMRVRTVSGTTYFCRTGKSFKGQVMDRFLLADCKAVLSGNYSFMWSFEKIHRCIAHLFLGELVTTFDEEFRILYAQSHPLVMENALVPVGSRDASSFSSNQFGFKRTQSLRNLRGPRHTELAGYSFGDRMDIDRNVLPLRRDDPFRHSLEPGAMQLSSTKYSSQQFRTERSYLDQGRNLMASRQMEINAYKRHSYAEGTQENYASSRQFMRHRLMNNLDEVENQSYFQREQHFYQGGGSGSAQGLYDKIKSSSYHQTDEYSDSGYPPELEPPGMYNRAVDYLSSSSSKDIKHDFGAGQATEGGGRYNQTNPKRPSVGQPYACQSSPTQLHPPENKRLCGADDSDRHQQDPDVKQGLRNWRISSFLSAFEDAGEEGLPLTLGPDAFDEPQQPPEGKFLGPESSVPRFTTRDLPKIPSKPDLLPRYGKPLLPGPTKEPLSRDLGSTATDAKLSLLTASRSLSTTEGDKLEEMEVREPREISITKHESFRNRLNPMLQRSSRLRSSLIFSSSKLEEHSSAAMKSGPGLNEDEDSDRLKTSSIVAQILEKRRSISREPFEWRSHKKMEIKDPSTVEVPEPKGPAEVTSDKAAQKEPTPEVPKDEPKVTAPADPPKPTPSTTTSSVNMNDPESRLLYFKELAEKRKASKMAVESAVRSPEPIPKKPELSETPSDTTITKSTMSITPAEPASEKIQPAPPQPVPSTPIITIKPPEPEVKEQDSQTTVQKETKPVIEVQKKEPPPPKAQKPLPSPKNFKKEILKPFKSSHSRHVSCGEEIFTDATDAEKSELKKSRSNSSSGTIRLETGEKLQKRHGSNTSLNQSEGGGDGKALEFLKKQTQRLKGFLGPKGDKKAGSAATAEDKGTTQAMSTVPEASEESAPRTRTGSQSSAKASLTDSSATTTEIKGEKSSHKPTSKPSPTRYQSSTTNVLYSSNLRDDTKVILEQISANSQKNRMETAKQSAGTAEDAKQGSDSDKKATEKEADTSIMYQSRNRFQRVPGSSQERDSLLKRIESMRKEKKVYSRFEMGNNLG